eukprot:2145120-Ditylum_brightwellii.AAC.1
MNEPALKTESEQRKWFDDHDLDNDNDKKILNLRKVPTLYCDSKLATLLGMHMLRAFTRNPHKKYLTSEMDIRSFNAYLMESAKLSTILDMVADVP